LIAGRVGQSPEVYFLLSFGAAAVVAGMIAFWLTKITHYQPEAVDRLAVNSIEKGL
jgi:FtsH-binding integral membrane protein